MSDLPTREVTLDWLSLLEHKPSSEAVRITKEQGLECLALYADGVLKTEEEWRDSLDTVDEMLWCVTHRNEMWHAQEGKCAAHRVATGECVTEVRTVVRLGGS